VLCREVHTVVQGLMGSKSIFIADGHHRYETGLKLREDLAAAGELAGDDDPANFCMMMLVGMSDPGLLILPTHRLVSGLAGLTAGSLAAALATEFEVKVQGQGPAAARAAWNEIDAAGAQELLGFGTVADGHWLTARRRSDAVMESLAPEHRRGGRALGVSTLHVGVRERLRAHGGTPTCRYAPLLEGVPADVAARRCDLACLVPPAGMEHVEAIASKL